MRRKLNPCRLPPTTKAQRIIQWSVIEAHRYDNVIKTFGVYIRQKISTVIYLRAVIFVCLLAYLLALGMFLILDLVCVCVCVSTISRFFGAGSLPFLSTFPQSWLLIIEFCFSFFRFHPEKSNEEKLFRLHIVNIMILGGEFLSWMFCFGSQTASEKIKDDLSLSLTGCIFNTQMY